MIVVSNTSPLNYLILIRAVDVLPNLFEHVVVPQAVVEELAQSSAPEPVRAWITSPPAWIDIRTPAISDPEIRLHPGERDVLCLALELNADLVLADDQAARRVAIERGLSVTGTLGVLDWAARRNLIDLPGALEALRQTNFRISEDLLESLLSEHLRRQNRSNNSS